MSSSRMPAATRLAGGVALWLLLLSLAASASAQGRSFTIGEVVIDAELRADGSMRVVEDRQFVYQGRYRGAFYTLPLRDGQQVTDFALSDSTGARYRSGSLEAETPGTYVIEQDGGEFRVTWFYAAPAVDTVRTYTLDYVVTRAAQRHADSAELYWQWVGTGWDVPTGRVVADVALPDGTDTLVAGETLLVWGHGPLTGTVEVVEPGVVRTEATDVPPNTFVELRAVFPERYLPDAPSDGREVLDQIVRTESCLAVAANADRARAAGRDPDEDCDPQAGRKQAASAGVAALAVGGLVGWGALFVRRGREHGLPQGLADYERDLPSQDPPALVDYLMRWGSVDDSALVATIMDLARQGKIALRRETRQRDRLFGSTAEEVLVMSLVAPADTQWEREVQDLLFARAGDGREVTDDRLKEWVKGHRNAAYSWWSSWTSRVQSLGRRRRWIDPQGPVAGSLALGVGLIGVGVLGGVQFGVWPPVIVAAVVAGAAICVATPLMRRRTPQGRVLHHRWRRFGAYLKEYSLIPERSPEALALWGRYLVYAVPLGVADEVMANLDARLSEAELRQAGGGWYPLGVGHGHHGGFSGGLRALSAGIPAATIASSPSSSGSGGGGGFSGGGGGGGGGSGGGAF